MSKHNYSQYANKNRDGKTGAVAANAVNTNNKPKQTVANAKPDEVKMEFEHGEKSLDRAVGNTVLNDELDFVTGPIEILTEVFTPMIETVEAACPPKTVEGVVVNCGKLNVRSKPSITGEVLCVLNASSEIEIDVNKSVPEWFYICTATGIEGYCMRKFVDAHL